MLSKKPKKKISRYVSPPDIHRRIVNLDLDPRFFPDGVIQGNFIEIKGKEATGKTLLITHLMASLVFKNPEENALLIDTTGHFQVDNFINILNNFITDDKDKVAFVNENDKFYPEAAENYLERVRVLRCLNPEDIPILFGLYSKPGSSIIENMLKEEKDLSLIVIDSFDNYSFIPALHKTGRQINVSKLIKDALGPSRTPIIVTTTDNFEPYSQSSITSGSTNKSPAETEAAAALKKHKSLLDELEEEEEKFTKNIIIDKNYFTHTLYLKILSDESEKKLSTTITNSTNSTATVTACNEEEGDAMLGFQNLNEEKQITIMLEAFLHAKNTPKTPKNTHRAKFSILEGIIKFQYSI